VLKNWHSHLDLQQKVSSNFVIVNELVKKLFFKQKQYLPRPDSGDLNTKKLYFYKLIISSIKIQTSKKMRLVILEIYCDDKT
jgi:hypothetical protein